MAHEIDNGAFYDPQSIGQLDIALSQTDKEIKFESVQGVFLPNAQVQIYTEKRRQNRVVLRTYIIGDGLELEGNNVVGESKTLTLTMQGSDFAPAGRGNTAIVDCSLFTEGDVEVQYSVMVR